MPTFIFEDGSTGWHLVTGRFILDNHTIPHQDLMSYTFPQAPWVPYEWLSDLITASIERLTGLNGLAVATSFLIALVFLLLYERCRRLGMNFMLSAFLIAAATLASSVHWLVRPHIFTFLGVYIFSTTLESFHRGTISKVRLIISLSVCMAFWVNLHPGFVLGFVLNIIYLVCELGAGLVNRSDTGYGGQLERARWYAVSLGTVFVSSLANPFGTQLYVYISHYLQNNRVLHVTNEFESPVFHGAIQQTCLEVLFLFLLLGLVMTKKRPSFPQLISCLAFAHLALSAVRNAPEFVIIALPFIADLFSDITMPFSQADGEPEPATWLKKLGDRISDFNRSFDQNEAACQMHLIPVIATVLLLFASIDGGKLFGQQLLRSDFNPVSKPTATLGCIRDNKLVPAQGFNYDNWGGYIRYRLGIPVFIDDRLDFYGARFYLDYGTIVQLEPGWSDLLERYHIRWVLFPKNSRLCRQLKENPNWKLLCEDQASDLFVKI